MAAMYQPTDENSHLSLTHGEEEMAEDFNPSISESGYDPADQHEQWPTSPGGRSTCSSQGGCGNVGRQRKRGSSRQSYNKNNVRMEHYVNKDPESITAKELRVLIPQMFLTYQHPQKEIGKSKVKGLWEKGNQPKGWPTEVKFRDPNNNPKMSITEMKCVFRFLKDSINPNPKPHTLKVKCEPRTPMVTSPVYQQSPPNLDAFHSDGPHYSSHLQGTMYTDGATSIQVQEQRPGSNFLPSIGSPPPSVGQIRSSVPIPLTVDCHEEEEQQAAMDHGVQLMNGSDHVDMTKPPFTQSYMLPETVSSRLESFQPSTLEPMAGHNQPVEVITQAVKQDGLNTITDLTVLHNMPLTDTDVQVISFEQPQNQGMIQLIQPQSSEEQPIAETAQPSEQKECVDFADSIQEELAPILAKFAKIYDGNEPVLEAVRNILCDTFGPLYNEATKTKESCMKFSKFSSQLQEILKRYTRMAGDANDIIGELNNLRDGFGITSTNAMQLQQQLPVMEDHCVPYVGHEVVVMKVTNDGTSEPKFIDSFNGPYIPTIAEIEARAQRKQQEIEGAPEMLNPAVREEMIPEEKVKVEKMYPDSVMSPMCQQLHGLNVGSPGQEQDPEKDLGISLKRSPSLEDDSSDMMNNNQLNELLSDIDFLNQTECQVSDITPAVTSWEGTENVVSQPGKQTQAAVFAPTQALDSCNGQPHVVTQATEQAELQPSMVDMQQAQYLQFIGNSTTGQSVNISGTPSTIGPVSCTHNELEEYALQATLASAHSHFGGLVLDQPYKQRDIRAAMNDYETRVIDDVWGLLEDYEINNQNQSSQPKQTDHALRLVKPSPDFTTSQMMDSGSPAEWTYTPCVDTRVCSPGLILTTGIKTESSLVFKVPEPCPPVKKVPKAAPVIPLTVLAIAEEASQDDVQTKRRTVEKGKKYGKGSQRLPYGKGMHQGGRHEKHM